MKLKGLSLVLPLADLRPICAPASRLHFLSPFAAKPSYTYLKDFGVCKERKLRIPWRPVETIFFECNRAVSLPLHLPDGAPVTRVMRRVYLDDTVAVRFDLSIFTNPLHRSPDSSGSVDDWARAFWKTPLHLRSKPIGDVLCNTLLHELRSRFIAASTLGPDVRQDLVDYLSPLLIVVVQAPESELSSEYVQFDRKPTLYCKTRYLQLHGSPESTTILCLAHLPTEYFRPRDAAFQQLRRARSFVAWLHTELQILESLTRRMHTFPDQSELLLGPVKVLTDSLLTASQTAKSAGLQIGALESLFINTLSRVGASLEKLSLQECAEKLKTALPIKESIDKTPTCTFSNTPPQMVGMAAPSLDVRLQSALDLYAKSLTEEVPAAPTRYDDGIFRESARRKAQEIYLRLPKSSFLRPPVVVSIGGGDGTELFEVLKLTHSHHGVLLDYSHLSTNDARQEAQKRELSVDIITGDAMQKLPDAMTSARQMSAKLSNAPIIVTMMAILHELPTRSPSFNFIEFFAKLGDAAVIIGREPIDPTNWTTEVLLDGAFNAKKFVSLASVVASNLQRLPGDGRSLGRVTEVAKGRIKGHRGLVLETLVKALYAEDILYEMQERFTTIRIEELLRYLEMCFESTHNTYSDTFTSSSISSSWRSFDLKVRASDDGRLLAMPGSHAWYEVVRK